MKRLLTLATLLTGLQLTTMAAGSILNLRMSDNSNMVVYLNGQEATGRSNTVQITNLNPGRHYLQVYRINRGWGHTTRELAYRGSIDLAANTESFVTVIPAINKIKFDNIVALNPYPQQPQPCFMPRQLPQVSPACPAPAYQPPVPVGPMAMNANDFQQLRSTLHNGSFESTRLSIFKQALNYNYFTTAQVCQLLDEFWFESTKLEVAKLAYNKTVDQQNYYLVNNSFSFSSSVNELGNYIAMR